MSEPDFLSQTGDDISTPEERVEWFNARAREATSRGATWHRFSHHPDGDLILYEGWKVRPQNEGEPRWQLTILTAEPSP